MNNKANLIQDVITPVFACMAICTLIYFTFQMWSENRHALQAEKNGPTPVSYNQPEHFRALWTHQVRIENADAGVEFSIDTDNEGRVSTAFVLFPQGDEKRKTNAFPVVIQHREVEDKKQAEAYRAAKSFEGTLSNAISLDLDHQDALAEAYPEIDFGNCYVLNAPARGGDETLGYVALGIFAFWFSFLCWFGYESVAGVRKAFSNGVTIAPERQVRNRPASAPPVVYRTDIGSAIDDEPAMAYSNWVKTVDRVSWLPSFCLVTKVVGILVGIVVLPMAFAGKGNLLPDWLTPMFMKLFVVAVVAWLAHWGLLYRKHVNPGNVIRKLIGENGLPWWQRLRFRKFDKALIPTGFSFEGDFLMKDNRDSVAREYLSPDGRSLVRVNLDDDMRIMAVYSLIDNGQVILTIDMELPGLAHPRIDIYFGSKGKVKKTMSIHEQVVAGYKDKVLTIGPDELHAFWMYCEALELQLVGRKPLEPVSLPKFRSLASLDAPNSLGATFPVTISTTHYETPPTGFTS